MARAQAPFQLRGKIDGLVFRVHHGRQIAYLAPEVSPRRHRERMQDRAKAAYRLNILEFAMASTVGMSIYKRITPRQDRNLGPILRPYSQNILTARLKQAACCHLKQAHAFAIRSRGERWFGTSIRLPDVVQAVKNLDLSHPTAPAEDVRMNPIGPLHNPTAIQITGLARAAQAIPTHGNARLECRIFLRQAPFEERVLTEDGQDHQTWEAAHGLPQPKWNGFESPPTDWIPVQIIPETGLQIPLPEAPADAKFVTAILVEWREVRAVGRKILRLHSMGIARIVSVHGPAEAFVQPPLEHAPAREAHQAIPWGFLKGTLRPRPQWERDPQAYLEQALARLKPK